LGFQRVPPVGCRRVHSHRFSHEIHEDPPILPIDSAIQPEKLEKPGMKNWNGKTGNGHGDGDGETLTDPPKA